MSPGWLPEQNRLRGELLLREPRTAAEAEAVLRTALSLARSQKSKSLELRVTRSLARLLRQQGQAVEARDLLLNCYNWFTEGLETADLREARELLNALERDTKARYAKVDGQRKEVGETSLGLRSWRVGDAALPLETPKQPATVHQGSS